VAFIYCNSCDWQQDDFYHPEGYTPLRQDVIEWLRSKLFSPIEIYPDMINGEDEVVTGPEFVARELERIAKSIRSMVVFTESEFMERVRDGTWRCPKCGSKKWSID
jgi:hypothetical protein